MNEGSNGLGRSKLEGTVEGEGTTKGDGTKEEGLDGGGIEDEGPAKEEAEA